MHFNSLGVILIPISHPMFIIAVGEMSQLPCNIDVCWPSMCQRRWCSIIVIYLPYVTQYNVNTILQALAGHQRNKRSSSWWYL